MDLSSCRCSDFAIASAARPGRLLSPLKKVALPLFQGGKHQRLASISLEIVGKPLVSGVISHAHVMGNDVISFDSAPCEGRNSLQEGFFGNLKKAGLSLTARPFYVEKV